MPVVDRQASKEHGSLREGLSLTTGPCAVSNSCGIPDLGP